MLREQDCQQYAPRQKQQMRWEVQEAWVSAAALTSEYGTAPYRTVPYATSDLYGTVPYGTVPVLLRICVRYAYCSIPYRTVNVVPYHTVTYW